MGGRHTAPRRALAAALTLLALLTACGTSPAEQDGAATDSGRSASDSAAAQVPDRRSDSDAVLRAPSPARSARQLATRLVAAEAAVRSPETPDAQRRQAAFETQVLYRQLARRADWRPAVLRAVGPRLRPTVRAHVTARRAFRAMHDELSRTLPAWRVVEPAPARELLRHYRLGERRFGVPWEVLAAVNLVETSMGRIRGTSVAGAQGPMQFMPATWAAFGRGDVTDDRDAILAAARYLAHNGGGRGRIDRALFAYNRDTRYVAGVKAYASVLRADRRAFHGLYHWQVVYLSRAGDVWLPEGYRATRSVPVARYVARHPEQHLGRATG